MASPLKPYVGPLTAKEIAAGIAASQANALRLIDDAALLLEADRYQSATALAILAMEERGKVIILKRLALVREPADIKEVWREYRSHRAKNAGSILPELVQQGARTMSAMASAVDAKAEHTGLLDAVKQISLYTDCLGDRHWSVPSEVVDESLARSMLHSAKMMWGSRTVSVRELELWGQLVGPHYGQSTMVGAIVEWQKAMLAEGLSETQPEELEAFMRGRPIAV